MAQRPTRYALTNGLREIKEEIKTEVMQVIQPQVQARLAGIDQEIQDQIEQAHSSVVEKKIRKKWRHFEANIKDDMIGDITVALHREVEAQLFS
jgi:hypothetical protein